mmetsp:Transcript_69931/g.130696  ORF Transcript_69931/g.130696 Transcript_69931/m.130696 type:complete len:470 (+) Transcript_69931:71-1480(+)
MERPKPVGDEAVVVFTTKLPERYRVPEDQLVLPSSLSRYGLSEVVNRLLSFEKPVPMDFLIQGQFLRTSLQSYLEAHRLSSEQALNVEYIIALGEPEPTEADQAPDWITGIASNSRANGGQFFSVVCCDGTLRLYQGTQSKLSTRISNQPLKCVASVEVDGGLGSHILASGKDGLLRCLALRHDGSTAPRAGPMTTLTPPTSGGATNEEPDSSNSLRTVEAVAFHEDGTLMGSAGWDNSVHIWNADAFQAVPEEAEAAGGKRKTTDRIDSAVPKFTLNGHSQVVTSLCFGSQARYPFTLMSSSWDCSVRVWDIAAADCVCNWTVGRAATSLSPSPLGSARLATSHEDGHISLWDLRAAPHSGVKGAFSLDASTGLSLISAQTPHKRMASQVAWCPTDEQRIASVGHDGLLCVLDVRSPKMPVQSLRLGTPFPMPTKVLCLAWLSADDIAVGGSDGKVLRINLRREAAAE